MAQFATRGSLVSRKREGERDRLGLEEPETFGAVTDECKRIRRAVADELDSMEAEAGWQRYV